MLSQRLQIEVELPQYDHRLKFTGMGQRQKYLFLLMLAQNLNCCLKQNVSPQQVH